MVICVYGASSDNIDKKYIEETEKLGEIMAKRGHGLVFGGGAHGLMGAVARGMHREGGNIIGVAPDFFRVDGILFENCTEFIRTETMRERKQIMEDKSDAFIMAPGGIGTFEEFFEILTLKQLGRHGKILAILNINGYYDKLIQMLENAISEGFMKPKCRELYGVFKTPEEVVNYIENTKAVEPESFINMKY